MYMNRLILLFFACLSGIPLRGIAQVIKASIFCETFDGTGDIGGNDGVFSSSGAISFPVRFDNKNWSEKSINGGAGCIRLGNSSGSTYSWIATPDIPVNAGNLTVSFDAGLWSTSKYATLNITRSLGGSNSSWKNVAITKGAFSTIEKQFNTESSGTLKLKFDNQVSTSKNSYFFIDNIVVYQDNASDEQQQKAHRIILSGNFTPEALLNLNRNLSQNFNIVSIDARDAVFPSGSTLDPANKNCLIYSSTSSNVMNQENVVVDGKCREFHLYDGNTEVSYPFYAAEGFTAEHASYDRDFSSAVAGGYYSSICVPFSFETSSGIKSIYQCTDYRDPVLEFTEVASVEGSSPALISVTEAQPFLSMNNVSVSKTSCSVSCFQNAASICGVYRLHDDIVSDQTASAFGYSSGQFLKVTQSGYFKPFRAFFSILNYRISSASSLSADFKVPAGIRSAAFEAGEQRTIYSLDGRVVRDKGVSPGIYVIHHKKLYLKH